MKFLIKVKKKIIYYYMMFIFWIIYGKSFQVGKLFAFRKRFEVNINDRNCHVLIGNKVFFNNDCSINCRNKITIGDGCMFGENVKIYDHNHIYKNYDIDIRDQGFSLGEVVIGNNCWIGSNVIILPGTKIGDNCVIGAGSVISEEIQDGMIVKQNRKCELTRRYGSGN